VGLLLIADHIGWNGHNKVGILVKLEQLGLAVRFALNDPNIALGVDCNARCTALTGG
jgi:hypothetical protein